MEEIKTPNKIFFEDLDNEKGKLTISPCYPGYGTTIANAMRRVLLSSLPGSAITTVKIKGVDHEFSTIDSVKEDVIDIILNLKQAKFRVFSDDPVKLNLKAKGAKEIKLGDFEVSSDVEIVSKDLKIATLEGADKEIEMEITVEKGRGYVPTENRDKETLSVGEIAVDAVYTPVRRVSYKVENVRVGQRTDFDKIQMDITTDGSITPKEAVEQAAKLLVDQFSAVTEISEADASVAEEVKAEETEKAGVMDEPVEGDPVEEADFSTRTMNALHSSGLRTLQTIAKKSEEELMAIDGIGKTSIDEIRKVLGDHSLKIKSDEK